MLLALALFSFGNVLCAVAPNMYVLIAARAIAGMGGGGLTSVGSTIMSDLVPITHRGIFQGYGNIMFGRCGVDALTPGLGSGLGAPLGGIINDHLGWRWAFYLQIPLLALSAVLIFSKVRYTVKSPNSSGANTPQATQTMRQKLARVDWFGSLTLAGFIGSSLLAVTLVTSATDPSVAYGWGDPLILGLFGASAVLFVFFLYIELRVAAEPVLPIELLTQRTPIAVAINNFTISVLSFGVVGAESSSDRSSTPSPCSSSPCAS